MIQLVSERIINVLSNETDSKNGNLKIRDSAFIWVLFLTIHYHEATYSGGVRARKIKSKYLSWYFILTP
jgi:hypothetical protein